MDPRLVMAFIEGKVVVAAVVMEGVSRDGGGEISGVASGGAYRHVTERAGPGSTRVGPEGQLVHQLALGPPK